MKKSKKKLVHDIPIEKAIELKPELDRGSKNVDWEEYLNILSNQMHPATSEVKERFFFELKTWARENPDAYHMSQFYDMKGITSTTVERWALQDDKFKESVRYAKRQIGYRRERGALERKLDPATVHFTMGHYCDVWREEQRIKAELRNKNNDDSKNITVVLPSYPTLEEHNKEKKKTKKIKE